MTDQEKQKKTIRGLKCLAGMNETKVNPCIGCGYDDCETYAICVGCVANDALALLKEQEPRVMTLDEVRRSGYHVFIELKDKNGAETIGSTDPEDLKEFKSLYSAFWHLHWRSGNAMLEEFYLGIPSERNYQETNKYNVTWRCWDRLPSDQIMEATPWIA